MKLEEEIKVDPESHTTYEIDQALAKLEELKASITIQGGRVTVGPL